MYSNFAATVATAGDVCSDVAIETVKVSSGLDASLVYNRSKHENDKDFLVYRAQKNSEQFAYMKKNESRGTCSGPLSDVCKERKVEFRGDSQMLLVKIFNTTVNDSGQYAVWSSFNQLHPDEKTAKCLKVIHVKVEGKEGLYVIYSIRVYTFFPLLLPVRESGDI